MPIDGPEADKLLKQYSFFSADEIPDDAYKGVSGVKTVSVHALWVTSSKQPRRLDLQDDRDAVEPQLRASCSIRVTSRAA